MFGKKKIKKNDLQPEIHNKIAQAIVPPIAFIATPRIAEIAYVPILVDPLHEFQPFNQPSRPYYTQDDHLQKFVIERIDENDIHHTNEVELSSAPNRETADTNFGGTPYASILSAPEDYTDTSQQYYLPPLTDSYQQNEDDDSLDDISEKDIINKRFRENEVTLPIRESVRSNNASLKPEAAFFSNSEIELSNSREVNNQLNQSARSNYSTQANTSGLGGRQSKISGRESQIFDQQDVQSGRSSVASLKSSRQLNESRSASKERKIDTTDARTGILPQARVSFQSPRFRSSSADSKSNSKTSIKKPQKENALKIQISPNSTFNNSLHRSLDGSMSQRSINGSVSQRSLVNTGMSRKDKESDINVEWKDETEQLKEVIRQLNAQLDRYQRKFQPLTQQQLNTIEGLPFKGPKPSWLVNIKNLSPLLLAYEDLILEKDNAIIEFEKQLQIIMNDFIDLKKENEDLTLQLKNNQLISPHVSEEWKQLREQCKLVIAENHLLIDQVSKLKRKIEEININSMEKLSELGEEVSSLKQKNASLKLESANWEKQCTDARTKCQDQLIKMQSMMHLDDHDRVLTLLKQSNKEYEFQRIKELQFSVDKEKLHENEKRKLMEEVLHLKQSISQFESEIKTKMKNEEQLKKDLQFSKKKNYEIEMFYYKVKRYLANVLQTAEKTAMERDDLVQSVKKHKRTKHKLLKQYSEDAKIVGELKDHIENFNFKEKDNAETFKKALKMQVHSFDAKKSQYETEIRKLRLLMQDKDASLQQTNQERVKALQDLENVWEATNKANEMIKSNNKTSKKQISHSCHRVVISDDEHILEDLRRDVTKDCVCNQSD